MRKRISHATGLLQLATTAGPPIR